MADEREHAPWKRLEELAEIGAVDAIRSETENLGLRETARAISRLDSDHQAVILKALDPEDAAELMEEIADAQAATLIKNLSPEEAAPILNEMDSHEIADVFGVLGEERAREILKEMDPSEADDARILARYPSDVAGGLMIKEYVAYPQHFTSQQVIDDLRRRADEVHEYSVQYVYVVDDAGCLVGVLPLRTLLLTPGDAPITEIMIADPISVSEDTTLEELEELFEEHYFLGVPVTDRNGKLVGVVEPDEIEEALGDRAQSDYLKTQGIIGGDELRSMPVLRRSGRRLAFLSPNIVLNLMSASVISIFEGTLEKVIALAFFLPIVSDMSGCSGNQAVAVSMRELSLGLIKPFEVVHVWIKEVSVGVLNGIVLGSAIAAIAFVWQGNPYLGLVIGGALGLNTIIAVSLGGTLPLIMKRIGFDPALASGPVLTTITDICGFFMVLSFATLMMHRLA